jgi:hypothetical protein
MTATDPRLTALAAALIAADAKLRRPADGTTRLRHRVGQYWFRDYAAAILAALPPGWCGHATPPEGTRLILATTDVLPEWGTRTDDGRRLTAEWGEPDANGWYSPTFTASGEPEIATLRAALDGLAKAAALPRNTRADRGGGVTLKGEWIAVPKADFDVLRAALAQAKEATDD